MIAIIIIIMAIANVVVLFRNKFEMDTIIFFGATPLNIIYVNPCV